MLDENDIVKLKEVFASKEHIDSRFNDLKENFATKTEIKHLIDIVVTKQDLEKLSTKTDKIVAMLGKMDEKLDDTKDLKHRVEYIESTLNISAIKK